MTHPTLLQLSMHADDALDESEAAMVAAHVDTCETCRAQLTAVRNEAQFITTALQIEVPGEQREVSIPAFSRPATLRGFALANLGMGLVIWLGQFLWKTVFGEVIVNAASWATSIYLPDVYAMMSATALHLLEEGTAMFDAYLGYVVLSLFAATALWLAMSYRKARAVAGVCVLMVTATTIVAPTPAYALELMRDEEVVTVAEGETIDDTVLVGAEIVIIEGTITGDLVAVGRRVEVSGTVQGNLISFAETVNVTGKVGGFALGAANTYDLRGATVGGDLWAAGEKLSLDEAASVGRNATLAGEITSVDGAIVKDLLAFSETVELNGRVGEDLEAFAGRLRLLGDSVVEGNVRFRSDAEKRLHRAETATVNGEVEFLGMPEEFEEKSRYATLEYYLWQAARLIGAFIVGMFLLWLFPGFRSLQIGAGVEAFKSAGVGFLALISVPVVAVLVAFTLVGLPVSFISIVLWMLGLYFAKILVGAIVGRMLLSSSDSLALTLLAGLTVVLIAVNLPFIGGFINFILTIVGFGLLVQYLLRTFRNREHSDPLVS